jgi:hypothetical protein
MPYGVDGDGLAGEFVGALGPEWHAGASIRETLRQEVMSRLGITGAMDEFWGAMAG